MQRVICTKDDQEAISARNEESLARRIPVKSIRVVRYSLIGLMCLLLMYNSTNLVILAVVFILAGVHIGIVDSTEKTSAADFLPLRQRGAYRIAAGGSSLPFRRSSVRD